MKNNHSSKALKVKKKYKILFDILYDLYKSKKGGFTLSLMQQLNIDKVTLDRYESPNELFLEMSELFRKELKSTSLYFINKKISESKYDFFEEVKTLDKFRININFRISENEFKKIKEVKSEYDINITDIFELTVQLFIVNMPQEDYVYFKNALNALK